MSALDGRHHMQVRETTLKQLVQGEKQFRVPLWQRQYTWSHLELAQLWRDVLEQYRSLDEGSETAAASSHFIGSFVLSPVPSAASGVASYLVVDGQQRLTTLMLMLCAMRDASASAGDDVAIEKYNELYLLNKFQSGVSRFRLAPTLADRDAFSACIESANDGGEGGIGDAYRFFRSQVELPDSDGDALRLDQLVRVITERLAIVDITTGPGDNAHRIFQSLNGTGVGLSQADLLRNYVFMLLPNRGESVYKDVWQPMEELVGFRHVEGLARVDLQRRGILVSRDDVYRLHQERLDAAGDENSVEAVVADLTRRAQHYKCLIDPGSEPDSAVRAGLRWLSTWAAQTTYPIIMQAYDLRQRDLISTSEIQDTLTILISFLVRRHLSGIATNSLARMFVQLIPELPEGPGFALALREQLSGDRRYWPSDDQTREAVRTRSFYFMGRAPQRKLILESLERSFEHPEPVNLEAAELSVEHIMPQTLNAEWREEIGRLGEDPEAVHDELVHTLGNLTLTAFNGQLSNSPFERKQEIYAGSHLELNKELPDEPHWGRAEIQARGERLAERIVTLWPGPLPGVTSRRLAFDWSRVNAAVAAIPSGRWCTYGDLAQIGGTGPLAVGQHVASTVGLVQAYRVLGADGRPRPDFRWHDPSDARDVRTTLACEGIQFGGDGAADVAQRISASELLVLITTPDVEDDPEAIDEGVSASYTPTDAM
jgi:alkylated DNA nucleotide flippase Atl1